MRKLDFNGTLVSLAAERLLHRLDLVLDGNYFYVRDAAGVLEPIAHTVVWDAIDKIRSAVIRRVAQLLDARTDLPTGVVDQLYMITKTLARSTHTGGANVFEAEHLGGRDFVFKAEHTGWVREEQAQAYGEILQLLEQQPQTHIQPLALAYDAKRRHLIGRKLPLSTLKAGLDRLLTTKLNRTVAKREWLNLLNALRDCMAAQQFLFDHDYYVADLKPENIGINTTTRDGVIFDLGYCGKLTGRGETVIAKMNIVREFGATLNRVIAIVSRRQLPISVEVLPELADLATAMELFHDQPTLDDATQALADLIDVESAL